MPHARRPAVVHPEVGELTIHAVLHALADPTRLAIVGSLRENGEQACGTFPVTVAPSTLTHHFRILREAGVIRQREEGKRRWNQLRYDELDSRFPGLLDVVLRSAPPVRQTS
ncbi:transcriptional regulator, ArsR family [Kribbella flavida DSM 17836]|uniref:Transcriptional regulator, ArsR family n=1 Tax=Kribbella flavida (strain DSM 17836 / JCM 10339 / NBRC 14399) TaxID=479435 RepID=D2Q2P3_KRIFD|nr:helix-turn-helix domain-containing protein [Kribbella flavida]ADB30224.1 transcriptional regulator, ArsR family [Kribbella flavida DSM 17836]